MGQPGGDPDLAEEALRLVPGRRVGPEHLDRHLAGVLEVFGEVHRGRPARGRSPPRSGSDRPGLCRRRVVMSDTTALGFGPRTIGARTVSLEGNPDAAPDAQGCPQRLSALVQASRESGRWRRNRPRSRLERVAMAACERDERLGWRGGLVEPPPVGDRNHLVGRACRNSLGIVTRPILSIDANRLRAIQRTGT